MTKLRYASVCDGIGAVHAAWKPLGWECVWASEIEPFPVAVVHHNFPEIRIIGDFTTIRPKWLRKIGLASTGAVDLLVGGTPCQSFSVAGLRGGMDDPRGGLAIEFLRLARRLRPRWLVWENVPGVLSSNGGRDFGSILGGMEELGYGWAYRILDAQYFGVAQRRRRVFVVGYLGDWRCAAAVLFERDCLCGNPSPSRQTGTGVTHATSPCIGASGRGFERAGETRGQDPVVATAIRSRDAKGSPDSDCTQTLVAYGGNNTKGPISAAAAVNAKGGSGRMDFESETFVAHALRAEGFDASEDGTGRGTPIIPFDMRQLSRGETMTNNRPCGSSGGAPGTGIGEAGDPAPQLCASHTPAIAFDTTQITSPGNYSQPKAGDPCHPLAKGQHPPAIAFDDRRGRAGDLASHDDVANTLHSVKGQSEQQVVAYRTSGNCGVMEQGDKTAALNCGTDPTQNIVAFQTRIARNGRGQPKEVTDALTSCDGGTHADSKPHVAGNFGVRRLTPMECERLQGFPDGFTAITYRGKPAADGPRYRVLGNSMAVPVVRWIGQRILEVEHAESLS